MVGLATLRLSTSPLHRHCYSSQQDELRTRITGQRACAPALQPGQRAHLPCRYSGAWVRGCARTHPGSARASCVPQLHPPSACPALLLVLPQFRTVGKKFAPNCPTDPTNFVLVFRSPQTLGVCGELMSNISATRGHPCMRICVCGSPRGDLSHIAGLTLGRSRSDFS
jgi:hypothetical protein